MVQEAITRPMQRTWKFQTHFYLDLFNSNFSKLVELLSKKKRDLVQISPTSQGETTLGSLSLRINEPYWMVHHGNCEHFIVVNQLRSDFRL